MYIPSSSVTVGTIVVPDADISAHTFLGVSWEILFPYTILGIVLMIYSQARLARGQRLLGKQIKTIKK
jgi:hypothetical protein